jgi:Hemerythrin HHE cation binding domain
MTRSPIEQPGLRLRLNGEVRRISSQHRQLDALFALVVEALESGSAAATRGALQSFRDAFQAHTDLEDGFYFPALHGLRAELAPTLDRFSAEHRSFRESFDQLEAHLDASDLAGLGGRLEGFAAELADHEAREEALLAEHGGMPPSSG